jgi:hypothetical protein
MGANLFQQLGINSGVEARFHRFTCLSAPHIVHTISIDAKR